MTATLFLTCVQLWFFFTLDRRHGTWHQWSSLMACYESDHVNNGLGLLAIRSCSHIMLISWCVFNMLFRTKGVWHLCATITTTSSFVLHLECFIKNIRVQIMFSWQGSNNIELFMGTQSYRSFGQHLKHIFLA